MQRWYRRLTLKFNRTASPNPDFKKKQEKEKTSRETIDFQIFMNQGLAEIEIRHKLLLDFEKSTEGRHYICGSLNDENSAFEDNKLMKMFITSII